MKSLFEHEQDDWENLWDNLSPEEVREYEENIEDIVVNYKSGVDIFSRAKYLHSAYEKFFWINEDFSYAFLDESRRVKDSFIKQTWYSDSWVSWENIKESLQNDWVALKQIEEKFSTIEDLIYQSKVRNLGDLEVKFCKDERCKTWGESYFNLITLDFTEETDSGIIYENKQPPCGVVYECGEIFRISSNDWSYFNEKAKDKLLSVERPKKNLSNLRSCIPLVRELKAAALEGGFEGELKELLKTYFPD